MSQVALAIDPGSSKCGLALVRREGDGLDLLWKGIVPTEELADAIAQALQIAEFRMVIVGNGTRSQPVVGAIRERFPAMGVLIVDERDTSLQARERYWEYHRRRGWRRLVPATMQLPPEPVDDFVALILAERVMLV